MTDVWKNNMIPEKLWYDRITELVSCHFKTQSWSLRQDIMRKEAIFMV